MKHVQHHKPLGKCNLNHNNTHNYTPLRIVKWKIVTILNAGEGVEKLEYQYIVDRNVKCYTHSENQLAVSYKIKHATINHTTQKLYSQALIPEK